MIKKLDQFHWHEALDRSLLAAEFFDETVAQHPAVRRTQQLRRDAKEISERLFRLYQTIGRVSSEKRMELLDDLFEHPVPHRSRRIKAARKGRASS